MRGAQALTQEMDVYAFGICCGEILTMGALPWPFMDDHAVRHSVLSGYPLPPIVRRFPLVMRTFLPPAGLDENMRPSLPPPSNLVNDQLVSVIRASWDSFPSNRPSFEQISLELKKQRAGRNAHSINSQTPLDWE
jgi:abelson tyrosine-protein kinase 1